MLKKHGYINPCQNIINDDYPLRTDIDDQERYKPVQFIPTNPYDSNAGITNIELRLDSSNEKQMFTEENEVIEDNTIVEFRYDITRPKDWRWVPLRIRYDEKQLNLEQDTKIMEMHIMLLKATGIVFIIQLQ